MKKSECLSLVFSSVSLIISIFVLVGNFPAVRKLGLDLDYLGVIIGILSFILMLLLGWNMFNAVELNRSMRILKARTGVVQREVNDSRKFVENKIDRITSSVQRKEEYMMGSVDFVQGMIKMNEGCFYMGYRLFISSLRHFLCCDEDVSG